MKVNEQWLREWVNPAVTVEQLSQQLTMAGLEVDSVNPVAGEFSKVNIGLVTETSPHPQADKLTLCLVDVGQEAQLSIVCGASNVRPNLKVAVAMVGAKLPNGMKIKKSKLRGEPSHGMLCSALELGLTDSAEGIMELPTDAPIGQCIREYMQLDDHQIEVDLTPNRGDCLSVHGIASEVAVLNEMSLETKAVTVVPPSCDDVIDVTVEDFDRCGQYCSRVVRGIDSHAVSPLWLTERLRRCGLRAIHPVVDVTNYVMLELGQPMHAFDLAKLKGGINVRLAKSGESLLLLDSQEITLRTDTLVIADDSEALAIAGVMGGLNSSVTESTTDIVFESAYFNFTHIAGVARSYNLSTDSSHRFERGVSPDLQLKAIERATDLLLMIAGGQTGPVVVKNQIDLLPKAKEITLRPERANQLLGLELTDDNISSCLTRLDMTVDTACNPWRVTVPARRFDISIEEDLIEEVARVYGYHKIEAKPIVAHSKAHPTAPIISLSNRLCQALVERAYNETISYSFVDPKLQQLLYGKQQCLDLVNPLSPELSQMRQGLWGGLLASVTHNHHRQCHNLRLFETGLCFNYQGDQLIQTNRIAGAIAGSLHTEQWNESNREVDFYDIKGDVEALLSSFAATRRLRFEAKEVFALHPGQSAAIFIDDIEVGSIGCLHPAISAALDLSIPVFLFELTLDKIPTVEAICAQPISKYPSIRRDLSFIVALDVSVSEIESMIWSIADDEMLRKFDVFDVYMGENIPEGKKSVAIGLTLQHASRTLIEADINSFVDAILKKLIDKFDIILRD